jgi:hypothetical protein
MMYIKVSGGIEGIVVGGMGYGGSFRVESAN